MTTVNACNDCIEEKVQGCTSCCKSCPDCPNCYDLDIEKIREYIYGIDKKISEYNQSSICISDWGYACKPVTLEQFEKLMIFREYINHYYQSLKLNCDFGICPNEIQKILEVTSKLIDLNFHINEDFSNVKIDDSQFDEWVLNNPYCVSYEDWEKCLIKICPKVGIEVTDVKAVCNFMYGIISTQITCIEKLLYTFDVIELARKNKCFDISINTNNCKLDYETIVEKHKCDLDFNTYISLINCNLSSKAIDNLLESNLDLGFDSKNNNPIVYLNGNSYNLTDIKVTLKNYDYTDDLLNLSKEEFGKLEINTLINSYNNSQLINSEING